MFECGKCGYDVPVEGTDVCSECARRDAMYFHKCVKTKTSPENLSESHMNIWHEMVHNNKKWRINDRYTKGCGHPFVKDTQGRCIFCKIEKQPVPLTNEAIATNLMESAEILRQRASSMEAKAIAIRSGFYLFHQDDTITSRQKAVIAGNKWYIHDEPCKHCGKIGERYVANGRCKNCGK